MHKMLMVWMAALLLLLPATMARSGEHRLGGGVNYWVALEDLDEDDVARLAQRPAQRGAGVAQAAFGGLDADAGGDGDVAHAHFSLGLQQEGFALLGR